MRRKKRLSVLKSTKPSDFGIQESLVRKLVHEAFRIGLETGLQLGILEKEGDHATASSMKVT